MLKLTLLVPALERLQQTLRNAVQATWSEAVDQVAALDPYTIEAALTGQRALEGSWGPETLLRVATAFARDRVRVRLREDRQVHEDGALIGALREVPVAHKDDYRHQLATIQRLEYFDNEQHLSTLHLPLEAGDIFAVEPLTETPGALRRIIMPGDLRRSERRTRRLRQGKNHRGVLLLRT